MAAQLPREAEGPSLRTDGYAKVTQEPDLASLLPGAMPSAGVAVDFGASARGVGARARPRDSRWLAGLLAVALVGAIACSCLGSSETKQSKNSLQQVVVLDANQLDFKEVPNGLCEDFGWSVITSKETCERAAREMGLKAMVAANMATMQWPNGCHYFKSLLSSSQDVLFINDNPSYHGDGKSATDLAKDGIRELVCMRSDGEGEKEQDIGAAAGLDEAEESDNSCTYVVGQEGGISCPEGTVPLNESECRRLPYHFGGYLSSPFEIDSGVDPAGCFFYNLRYYYNTNARGGNHSRRTPYCKRCKPGFGSSGEMSGDWTEWQPSDNDEISTRYRKLSLGTCADFEWYPIRTKDVCDEAAEELGLLNLEASVQAFAERPEGCYFLKNYQDGTSTLWLNVNQFSEGNGAETSDLARGKLRQPICSKEKLDEALPASSAGSAQSDDAMEVALPGDLSDFQAADGVGSDAVSSSSAIMQTRFRKIKSGTCKDRGFRPITTKVVCEMAAGALALVETLARPTEDVDRPEGCYYLQNFQDLTATLWINSNPASMGKGAETSDSLLGTQRQPICDTESDAVFRSRKHELIAKGTCKDGGMESIHDEAGCEAAAADLDLLRSGALGNGTAIVAKLPGSPEGCYIFVNSNDGTTTLWVNTAIESTGRGATSKDGLMRQPICNVGANSTSALTMTAAATFTSTTTATSSSASTTTATSPSTATTTTTFSSTATTAAASPSTSMTAATSPSTTTTATSASTSTTPAASASTSTTTVAPTSTSATRAASTSTSTTASTSTVTSTATSASTPSTKVEATPTPALANGSKRHRLRRHHHQKVKPTPAPTVEEAAFPDLHPNLDQDAADEHLEGDMQSSMAAAAAKAQAAADAVDSGGVSTLDYIIYG